MSRPMRILRNVAVGLAIAMVVAFVSGILVVRSDWFRNYVRRKIITSTEDATGGKVAIRAFRFDWTHMSAVVTDFVIHGSEPPGAPPFLSAARVEVHLRLLTSIHRILDIAYLGIERPQANISVAADGTSNVPKPKHVSTSPKSAMQSVVDLAVGHFELSGGSVTLNSQKQDFNLRGDSLRVQLWYDLLKRSYKGEVSLAPLYVAAGRNTPVKFQLDLPLVIESDCIDLKNGQIRTDSSQLLVDATLENWQALKTSAHVRGQLALADIENLGNLHLARDTRGLPPSANVDIAATVSANEIDVSDSRIAFGGSSIHASGKLQDPAGTGAMQFDARLALAELSRVARLEERPRGMLEARGLAKLVPHRLSVDDLRVDAFGGEISGAASLEDLARYTVNTRLAHFDLGTVMRDLGRRNPGYSAIVSGTLDAAGDLKSPGTNSLTANARLAIAPGRQGIPVNGRIVGDYRGATGNLTVGDSFVALPHSRLNLNGSLGNRVNVALTTTDLADFSPLTGGNPPIVLAAPATFTGAVSGQPAAPRIAGHLAAGRFTAEGRQFDSLEGDVSASRSSAALTNGILKRGTMQAQLSASAGLRDWAPAPNQPLTARASIRNGDLADALALAGQPPQGYSGALSADANISGTFGNPQGKAHVTVANGTLHGQPIDSLQADVTMSDQLVTVTNAAVTSGPSRADLTAEFHHPRDHFDRGQVHAHLQTNQVDLASMRALQNLHPNSSGTLQATADFSGQLGTTLEATNVTADATAHALRIDGNAYGDLTATARTSGQNVTYRIDSNFAGSKIAVNGSTSLAADHRTTADANISGLPIERALAAAGRTDVPATGTLTAAAHVSGTLEHPEGSLDATIDRATYDGEPIDRIHVRGTYQETAIDVPDLEVRAGSSALDASAHYDHKPGVLKDGELRVRISNAHADLAHLRQVQAARPGLAGVIQLTADGSAAVVNGTGISAHTLNLNLTGKGLAMQGKNLGDLNLTAGTTGSRVTFALDSNLAGASIQGKGDGQLSGDYPVSAQLNIHNLDWKGLQPLLGATSTSFDYDAVADASVTVNGPLRRTDALTGRVEVPRFQLTATTPGVHAEKFTVQNQGPIVLAVDRGAVRIQSLHLTGPQTDVQASGSVSLTAQTMQATFNAHTDLGLLHRFDSHILSSGQIVADATLRGTFSSPLINGKMQVQQASLHLPDFTTGLSNANGEIDFNGSSASFRNLTGEVGGGKVVLSGFAAFRGTTRMALRINATKVRIRPQEGVSATADAELRLSGRPDHSVLDGTATIRQITYAPQSDLGAILSRAAPEAQSPSAPSEILDNMKLDVTVRTTSATAVHASVAQSLQVDANLHIQNTAARPGVTGRINISEGKLVFLNSTYTVNSGSILFYNPVRIDPILNLSLETKAQGVDVTLRVTGPIDNMKLSYTSDPPIQFQEIVGLLAAGQTPTSDPNLLANQPTPASQSFTEMGESAVVSQALADPIANRLQRVFGITQFKIDPTFANGQGLPQAQLSLQQQVTSRITLDYSTPVQGGGSESVSGQYLFSREWSATATRDQFGLFSIKLLYKRHFK